jgi:hypothetical protein
MSEPSRTEIERFMIGYGQQLLAAWEAFEEARQRLTKSVRDWSPGPAPARQETTVSQTDSPVGGENATGNDGKAATTPDSDQRGAQADDADMPELPPQEHPDAGPDSQRRLSGARLPMVPARVVSGQETSDQRIAEIRAREQKATEGPWEYRDGGEIWARTIHLIVGNTGFEYFDDAEFAAHARQDIPYLLDALTVLQQRIEEWGRAISPCAVHAPDVWEGDGTCVICELQATADKLKAAEQQLDALWAARDGQTGALASAMRKMLPPALLAEVVAHLDPLTPFVEFLRTFDELAAAPEKGGQ